MKTILVSGASGIVGYGVLRSLRKSGISDLRLIGTTIYENTAAEAFSDVFEKAPLTSDPGYIRWLTQIIGKHKVNLIIPGIEADMYSWFEHADEIQNAGAKILMNNPALIDLCRDKWTFYEHIANSGEQCVIMSSLSKDFEELTGQFGLPLLVKPRQGFASKGIMKIADEETFKSISDKIGPTLMVQPYVGTDNEEYTAAAFGDGKGGYFARMTMRRNLSKEGFTEKAEVVWPDEIGDIIARLCQIFKPEGPTNFQFRKHGSQFKLLEINPRISSSTSIRAAFGYNEAAMSVNYFLNGIVPVQPEIRQGKAIRYTEDFIFAS